jgi:motility quorum-sensing regulator/GCU-specific mRNA interferase toxin
MTAYQGARALGIDDLDGMCQVVLRLAPRDFHKSMTTHADHRLWQDVYRTRLLSGRMVYLKLTVIDDLLVVSFKEL